MWLGYCAAWEDYPQNRSQASPWSSNKFNIGYALLISSRGLLGSRAGFTDSRGRLFVALLGQTMNSTALGGIYVSSNGLMISVMNVPNHC